MLNLAVICNLYSILVLCRCKNHYGVVKVKHVLAWARFLNWNASVYERKEVILL